MKANNKTLYATRYLIKKTPNTKILIPKHLQKYQNTSLQYTLVVKKPKATEHLITKFLHTVHTKHLIQKSLKCSNIKPVKPLHNKTPNCSINIPSDCIMTVVRISVSSDCIMTVVRISVSSDCIMAVVGISIISYCGWEQTP